MLPRFQHDPYGGLIALREHMPSLRQDLDSACAYAEQELGCVPSGRLRTYVLLSAGAAMLQRVRDGAGVPLFIVKGGLIWQAQLRSNARPTYDLDGALTCDIYEFVDAILLSRLCDEGTYCTYEELAAALKERVAYENESRLACGYPPFESPLRSLPYDNWAVEYLIAGIQSGLKLTYDDAIAELTALFERLDP